MKWLFNLFRRRKKDRTAGVKLAVINSLLTHKYLDFLEVAQRARITPEQATCALSYLYRHGKIERVKGHPSIPANERGKMVQKFCWRYRLAAKAEPATPQEGLPL
jgi:hypothetical protein